MTDDAGSTEFNWVQAREECSVVKMFLQLRDEVQGDLKHIKTLSKGSGRAFDFKQGSDKFTVFEGTGPLRTVAFFMSDDRSEIIIEHDNGDGEEATQIHVRLTLNNDRQCRFLLNEEELESWQLRKRVLERLFWSVPVGRSAGFRAL